jgi:Flp pilus assembly CpaF family ATPase
MVDAAIDVVIHMSRRPYGKRLVTQIAKVISSPPTESHPPRLQYIFRHHDS